MIMLTVFGVVILIIACVLLPQLMYLTLVSFVGYWICGTLRRKYMGQMIIILCVFVGISMISNEIMPVINTAYDTKEKLIDSVVSVDEKPFVSEKTQEIEEIIKDLGKNEEKEDGILRKIWNFLNKYPGEDKE